MQRLKQAAALAVWAGCFEFMQTLYAIVGYRLSRRL
jgi:hypothetical protein